MPEKDGITRIYVTDEGGPNVREVYPKYNYKNEIVGLPAQEILDGVDFKGGFWIGNQATNTTSHEGYGIVDKETDEKIDVSTIPWDPNLDFGVEVYKRIAESIEERKKKKGLTIVIS